MTAAAATMLLNKAVDGTRGRRKSTSSSRRHSTPTLKSLTGGGWRREQADDGRVYFFNPSTGASQWHVPNELYRSKFLGKVGSLAVHENTKMPGSARALHGIDCMMSSTMLDEEEIKQGMMGAFGRDLALEAREIDPHDDVASLESERVFRVRIVKARGLRDTDFMPGADKSDPYCMCEVPGKPHLTFKTAVVSDCLDPVWNHEELVVGFEEGDSLEFSVWDYDETDADGNMVPMYSESQVGAVALWMDGDDCLGKLCIRDASVLENSKAEYQLVDTGGGDDDDEEPPDSFLTVETCFIDAWPSLLGTKAEDAVIRLKRKHPELHIVMYEMPDAGSPVVSVDPIYAKEGYSGNFFGVHPGDAEKLAQGSVIEVAGQRLTVTHLGPVTDGPRRRYVHLRYVFFESHIKGVIREGETWKKVTPTPCKPAIGEGRGAGQVCIWYDYCTGVIAKIPYVG